MTELDYVKSHLMESYEINSSCLVLSSQLGAGAFGKVMKAVIKENVELPNAFTPDGDGLNDKFRPLIPEDHLEEIHSMTIYNRWGNIVYEAEGNDACWDGTYKDKPAAQDVYYFVIVVGCSLKEEVIKGDLTLFR